MCEACALNNVAITLRQRLKILLRRSRSSRKMSRQLDGERASFARTIPSAKRPAVSLDGLPCNGQPQAKPAPIGSCLNERSEDLFDLLAGETTTGVIDIDGDSVVLKFPTHADRAADVGKLHGVADEVGERRPAEPLIGLYLGVLGFRHVDLDLPILCRDFQFGC